MAEDRTKYLEYEVSMLAVLSMLLEDNSKSKIQRIIGSMMYASEA